MIYAGRFSGRNAIITGGASGLGLETAKRIAAEGGKVSLWDMNPDALTSAKKETGAVHAIALDVSDAKAVSCRRGFPKGAGQGRHPGQQRRHHRP
jgi:2-dehydro-3-deoxy-L-rhamnonate dehydrogenase (NAD+)